MTLKELSQLYYLNREIEMDKKRLYQLEMSLFDTPRSDILVNELREVISEKNKQCLNERIKLERYIADVPDSMLRQIFTYRFINGLSWVQVAMHVGGGNTEDSVRKMCCRYIRKTKTI